MEQGDLPCRWLDLHTNVNNPFVLFSVPGHVVEHPVPDYE